ncbi:MAG: hypothetical protein DI596_05475 [Azospira oryzae]|nr:MAG: hypothetical protein DI596_05475 [Azospira oryzae]PZP80857.1 MAG: hypothetical protein DI593_05475 [Azospira oryzae]
MTVSIYAALVLAWPWLANWPENAREDAFAIVFSRAAEAAGWQHGTVRFAHQNVPIPVLAQLAREHPQAEEVVHSRMLTIWFPIFSSLVSSCFLFLLALLRKRRAKGEVVRGTVIE